MIISDFTVIADIYKSELMELRNRLINGILNIIGWLFLLHNIQQLYYYYYYEIGICKILII